jgi:50S ribosomal protein L16 3-hydroxylase
MSLRQKPSIEIDASRKPPLGMSPAAFLRDYWQKRPLLIRNAFPGFVSPLEPEDLAGLACEETALSRIVSHDRGKDIYRLRSGPFREDEFPAMPDKDWTLLVQDVDKWDADVAALLPRFAFLPRWRVDDIMISFAAPGGSVGAHVDQYDVFLLQAKGHRRWQIDARPDPPLDFRPDAELKLLQRFDPSHDWVLGPGDMLYLPPGVPHHGVAEDACLTISVGMRAPSQAELVMDLAEHVAARLPDEQRLSDPDLAPARDPFRIDDAALARVRSSLSGLLELDDASLREWFGGFITRYRAAMEPMPPARALGSEALAAAMAQGSTLRRHPYARLAWSGSGRKALLFAAGEALPCPASDAARICAAEALDAGLYAALSETGRAVVHHLQASGSLVLQRPRRSRSRT